MGTTITLAYPNFKVISSMVVVDPAVGALLSVGRVGVVPGSVAIDWCVCTSLPKDDCCVIVRPFVRRAFLHMLFFTVRKDEELHITARPSRTKSFDKRISSRSNICSTQLASSALLKEIITILSI